MTEEVYETPSVQTNSQVRSAFLKDFQEAVESNLKRCLPVL